MADLQAGTTFVTGGEVTADSLNNLVNQATLANISTADLDSTSRLVTVGASTPTANAGTPWFNTVANTAAFGTQSGELQVYSGGIWHSAALNTETVMAFSGTVLANEVLVLDSTADSTVKRAETAGDTGVVGVAVEGTLNDKVRVCRTGYARVKVSSAVTPAVGSYIKASATTGEADATATLDNGVFGRLVQDLGSDVWAALIHPPVNYVRPTTTEILLQQNTTSGTTANGGTGGEGCTIPGTGWTGTVYGDNNDDGSSPTVDTLHPLTWLDNTISPDADRDVTVEGTVAVGANQMIHVELKDFALGDMTAFSTSGKICDSGLAVIISDNATGDVKSIKQFPGWQTHTIEISSGDLTTAQIIPGMGTYIFEDETIGSQTLQDAIWWKSLEHSFTADATGTYKVKVYWFVGNAGYFQLLNPNTTIASGTMGDLGMGKPTLKVVVR